MGEDYNVSPTGDVQVATLSLQKTISVQILDIEIPGLLSLPGLYEWVNETYLASCSKRSLASRSFPPTIGSVTMPLSPFSTNSRIGLVGP